MRTLFAFWFLGATTVSTAQLLSAEEAVRIAIEQNHGIRLAKLDARTSELMNTAGNAGMLPTVDAVGSYAIDNSSTKQTFFSGDVRNADNADQRVLDGAVQLNWTVFDGLAMWAAKDRLEALEGIGQTRLRQQVEATAYDVLAKYYQLVQLRKAIGTQQEGARISGERLRIAEAGQRIGSASGLQVVQARLDLSTDSTVQQARQQAIAADLSVKELRGVLMPKLDLYANYGYTKSTSAVGLLQSSQSIGPDYGARISVPLFHGGQAGRALQVAKLAREQAGLTTQQAELDLEESILNAWTAYTTAAQRTALEEQNLAGARTQTDVALESYRLGAVTAVELRDVQLGLIAAEQRLLVARYEAKMAETRLKWLAGTLV